MSEDVAAGSHRLLLALRAHDSATHEHCLAVGDYGEALARAIGLDGPGAQRIGDVGRLHDVGKIAVPVQILRARGPLDPSEVATVRDHATAGGRLLAQDPQIAHLAHLVRAHHERIDGNGYPDALKGTAIPLESRVVAIADTFDVLTAGRPYRPGMRVTDALAVLSATRGRQWDPELVDAFVALIERAGAVPRLAAAAV